MRPAATGSFTIGARLTSATVRWPASPRIGAVVSIERLPLARPASDCVTSTSSFSASTVPVTPTARRGWSSKAVAGMNREISGNDTGCPVTSRSKAQGDVAGERVRVPSTVSVDSAVRAVTVWKRQPLGTLTIRPASDRRSRSGCPARKVSRRMSALNSRGLLAMPPSNVSPSIRRGMACVCATPISRTVTTALVTRISGKVNVARGLFGSAGGRGFSSRATFQPCGVRMASITGWSIVIWRTVRPVDARSPTP